MIGRLMGRWLGRKIARRIRTPKTKLQPKIVIRDGGITIEEKKKP